MGMKAWRDVLLRLLCCALTGLASAGCVDNDSWAWSTFRSLSTRSEYRQVMQHERAARKRTIDMLMTAYRTCLAKNESDEVCRRDLVAYRSCLDTGGSDALCRAALSE